MSNYMGSDGVIRSAGEHVIYLRRCAERWRQAGQGYGQSSKWRAECEEQARAVERQADEVESKGE